MKENNFNAWKASLKKHELAHETKKRKNMIKEEDSAVEDNEREYFEEDTKDIIKKENICFMKTNEDMKKTWNTLRKTLTK